MKGDVPETDQELYRKLDRKGWLTPADREQHRREHTSACRCMCRDCRAARQAEKE